MECGALEPNKTPNNTHSPVVTTANRHTGFTRASFESTTQEEMEAQTR